MPIKYLGSKRVLLPAILRAVRGACPAGTVLDLFSGTSRVGAALKAAGYRVFSNDHNAYAETIARCFVEADRERWQAPATRVVRALRRVRPKAGWFTETYCVKSRFFHPRNGARIDAVRERIARLALPMTLEAIALVSLMEAADRVDSTTGLQMAYLKAWAPRALGDLDLRVPALLPRPVEGPCRASRLDAIDAAARLPADVAYLDPPYNQHSFLGNYHVWESLVLWDKPDVYGTACKRADCRTRRSAFNSRQAAPAAMRSLVEAVRAPVLVVSFNDEGYIDRATMEEILSSRGSVATAEIDHKRYVGAQIGIYNPRGEKVGRVGRLRNREFLFVVTPKRRRRRAPVSAPADARAFG